MQNMKCPKCEGVMEKGLQVDAAPGGARRSVWIKGEELPTIKMSVFPPKVELTGERYVLDMYRCQSCGFVESYATETA